MAVLNEHTVDTSGSDASVADRDDITRYLCAAAHLNPNYADAVVAEMLTESTRATAPSPGVNASAVLAEAVAARVRVRIVASVSLCAAFALALLWPTGLVLWFLLAIPTLLSRMGTWFGSEPGVPRAGAVRAASVVFLVLATIVVLGLDIDDLAPSWAFFLVLAALLGVYSANRIAVYKLIAETFQRRPGTQASVVTRQDLALQCLSDEYMAQIEDRYLREKKSVTVSDTDATDLVPLVVYRGYNPFVGGGIPTKPGQWLFPWSASRRPLSN
ncbi:hypothetical protein ACTG9Q_22215 [Actinokineospora sp. 24-640]